MALAEYARVPFRGIEVIRLPFRPPEKPSNQTERLDRELKFFLEQGHLPKKPHKILSAEVGDPVFNLHLLNQRDSGIVEHHAYEVLDKWGWNPNEYSIDFEHEKSNSDSILQTAIHPNRLFSNAVFELKHYTEPKTGIRKAIEVYIVKKNLHHEEVLLNHLPFPRSLDEFVTEFSKPR